MRPVTGYQGSQDPLSSKVAKDTRTLGHPDRAYPESPRGRWYGSQIILAVKERKPGQKDS